MFEDTLLILKSDYMMKRKPLLIHLLGCGFQIQGHRKLLFTPELAAEFYRDQTDQPHFMMFVIMLSKGNSEAFILTKENAIEDLLNTMVCYFGTSVEMERNIHVTKCARRVRREISFIFPNYIYEPIFCPDQMKFCANNPIIKPLVDELYEIVVNKDIEPHKNWKIKLSEFFERTNSALPEVSNVCASKPWPNLQEQGQQTIETSFKHIDGRYVGSGSTSPRSADMSYITDGSTLNVSTSSCLSCSKFDSGDVCIQQARPSVPLVDLIKAKTAPLKLSSPSGSDHEVKEQLSKECVVSKSKTDLLLTEQEEQEKPLEERIISTIAPVLPFQMSVKLSETRIETQIEPQDKSLPISATLSEGASDTTVVKEISIADDVEEVKEVAMQPSMAESIKETEVTAEVVTAEESKEIVPVAEQPEEVKPVEEAAPASEATPETIPETTPETIPETTPDVPAEEPQPPEAPEAPVEENVEEPPPPAELAPEA